MSVDPAKNALELELEEYKAHLDECDRINDNAEMDAERRWGLVHKSNMSPTLARAVTDREVRAAAGLPARPLTDPNPELAVAPFGVGDTVRHKKYYAYVGIVESLDGDWIKVKELWRHGGVPVRFWTDWEPADASREHDVERAHGLALALARAADPLIGKRVRDLGHIGWNLVGTVEKFNGNYIVVSNSTHRWYRRPEDVEVLSEDA